MKYITRKEAIEKGLKYYFTGKPCKYGHISKQYVAGGCFICRKDRAKNQRVNNREKYNEYFREYQKENRKEYRENHLRETLLDRAKQRSKKRNWICDLEKEDIIIPEKCPVFGKKFVHWDKDWGYSLDRINNNKPYIKGNVCVISKRANRMKVDNTKEDLINLLNYLNSYV